jgi:hypothetical protein
MVELHDIGYGDDSQTVHRGILLRCGIFQNIVRFFFFFNLCVLFFQMAIEVLGQVVIK